MLLNLHDQILADQTPPYDARLALTEQQYEAYQYNTGHLYYLYLSKLVNRLKPRKILELGTSIGRSASYMMITLPDTSTLTTVDIGSYLRTDLSKFAHDSRLIIIFGDDLSDEVFKQVGNGFDLLFIDSEHSYDQVSKEWELYHKLLVDGTIVVMDDIHLNEGMERFWDSLKYEKIDTGNNLHFSGFGLFVYNI